MMIDKSVSFFRAICISAELLQRVLERPLEKKAGKNYAPPGNKKLVYFIDDINMPMVGEGFRTDAYVPNPSDISNSTFTDQLLSVQLSQLLPVLIRVPPFPPARLTSTARCSPTRSSGSTWTTATGTTAPSTRSRTSTTCSTWPP